MSQKYTVSVPNNQMMSEQRPAFAKSRSATETGPPQFETNFNIQQQYYLSRGGPGRLVRQRSVDDNIQDTVDSAATQQYVSVTDKYYPRDAYPMGNTNGNNNKLNFGQLYGMSQGGHRTQERSRTPQQGGAGSNHNIPKCNSLDSVLESRKAPLQERVALQHAYHQQQDRVLSNRTPPTQYRRDSPRSAGTPDPDMGAQEQVGVLEVLLTGGPSFLLIT